MGVRLLLFALLCGLSVVSAAPQSPEPGPQGPGTAGAPASARSRSDLEPPTPMTDADLPSVQDQRIPEPAPPITPPSPPTPATPPIHRPHARYQNLTLRGAGTDVDCFCAAVGENTNCACEKSPPPLKKGRRAMAPHRARPGA